MTNVIGPGCAQGEALERSSVPKPLGWSMALLDINHTHASRHCHDNQITKMDRE